MFTLDYYENHFELHVDETGAVLLVDGEPDGRVEYRLGPRRMKVGRGALALTFLGRGRATGVRLIHNGTSFDFAPPPGTKAAQRHAWSKEHPELWAARHVAIAIGRLVLPLLGLGALIKHVIAPLIPHVDLPDLPDLPDIHIPFPHIPTPPQPIEGILDYSGYWIPVVIALIVARREAIRRARARQQEEAGR